MGTCALAAALSLAAALAPPATAEAATSPLSQAGSSGAGAGQLSLPSGVAIDRNGRLSVADLGNDRISQFTASGTFIRAFGFDVIPGGGTGFEVCTAATGCKAGVAGGAAGQLSGPRDIAVDAGGSLHVADRGNHRVSQFTESGQFIRAFGFDVIPGGGTGYEVCTAATGCKVGVPGGAAGQLSGPHGIAVDVGGALYVTDSINQRVNQFTATGAFISAGGGDVIPGDPVTGFEVCTEGTGCKQGVQGGEVGQLSAPEGLTIDDQGVLFVADSGNHRVARFTTTGTTLQWVQAFGFGVVTGGSAFEICTGLTGCQQGVRGGAAGQLDVPHDVAIDDDGTLWVIDHLNHRVSRYVDAAGSPSFESAFGFDVDPAGGTGFEICTTATGCKQGVSGGAAGQLDSPEGIALDCRGAAWVADTVKHRLQRFGEPATLPGPCTPSAPSSDYGPLAQIGSLGSGAGGLSSPGDVALDDAGVLHVADTNNHRISQFTDSGDFIRAFGWDVVPSNAETGFEVCTTATGCEAGTPGFGAGQLFVPLGLAVDDSGVLHVVDQGNARVAQFSSTGAFIRAFGWDVIPDNAETAFEVCTAVTGCQQGGFGGEAGQLSTPRGIAAGEDGAVHVADPNNARISQFTSTGSFVRAFGWDVDPAGGTGLEVCTEGTSCKAGVSGGGAGQLSSASGVASDADGIVYVSEQNNRRISQFTSTGAFIRAFGWDVVPGGSTRFEICTGGTGCKSAIANAGAAGQLSEPRGLAVDDTGTLHVADYGNNRISQLTDSGHFARALGFDLIPGGGTGFELCTQASGCKSGVSGGAAGQLSLPSGVAVDCRGAIWVADENNDRLQRFGPPGATPCTATEPPVDPPVDPPPATPSNAFSFAGVKSNRKRGTALLFVRVPGRGALLLRGKGIRVARRGAPGAGRAALRVRPKGKVRRKLARTGRARVRAKVTYTPAGGTPRTKVRAIRLTKKRR